MGWFDIGHNDFTPTQLGVTQGPIPPPNDAPPPMGGAPSIIGGRAPVAPGGQADTTGGWWGTFTKSTSPSGPSTSAPPDPGNINTAFEQFVNANPQYAGGGQGAIDAFGAAYPQYSGIIAWDPNRQIYESQGGYFTNLNGTGWSLTPKGPDTPDTSASTQPSPGSPGGVPNPLAPPPFTYAPFTDQFTNPNFVAPTGLTEQNDPGYQARLKLGSDTLQASAAGKGTLLTGQTANDLNQYAQDFASNEFGQVYNRALTDYQTQSANNFQQYTQKYQQYLNGYQQALQGYNTNLGAGQQAFGDTLGLSSQLFGQNQQNWQNQFNVAQLGLNAASAQAGIGSGYANAGGGYLQGMGNAGAAGTIGAGNAWSNGLSNLANLSATPFFQSAYGTGSQGYRGYGTPGYPGDGFSGVNVP